VSRALRVLLGLLALSGAAGAHSFDPALLDLREDTPGVFDVVWKTPGPAATALRPHLPPACRTLAARQPDDGNVAFLRVDCGPAALHGATIVLEGLGTTREAIVQLTWSDGQTTSGVLRGGEETFAVPAAGAHDLRAVLGGYLRLGIAHILGGPDHLAFVLGLLLLVETWRSLVSTVTAFTLAHSLTLALAVLGVVRVPPAPVEALIALSILLLAVELTRPARATASFARRFPWVLAFLFGLLHGLGFAGALTEIGLPAGQIPLALVSFNLGVEAGQLLFVATVVPLVVAARRVGRRPWTRLVPAYAIGVLAAVWMLERIARFWSPAT
jgi:hydrogenase/urease accessory protein HupE